MSIYTENLRDIAANHGWPVCDLAADEIDDLERAYALLFDENSKLKKELKALPTPAPTMVDERGAEQHEWTPVTPEQHKQAFDAGDLMAFAEEAGGARMAENVVQVTRSDLQNIIQFANDRATRPTLQSLGGDAGVSSASATLERERAAFIAWLGRSYPHAYDEMSAAHRWDNGHVVALAWQARSTLSLTSTEKSDGWVSFTDRLPPDLHATDDPSVMVSPRVLVTNNIHAKTRTGRPANVWYVYPLRDESNDEWFAFDESVGKIYNLTHWFDPFASLPAAPKAAEKSGRSE